MLKITESANSKKIEAALWRIIGAAQEIGILAEDAEDGALLRREAAEIAADVAAIETLLS